MARYYKIENLTYDVALAMIQYDSDGNLYVQFEDSSLGILDNDAYKLKLGLAKFSPEGALLWSKVIYIPDTDAAYGSSAIINDSCLTFDNDNNPCFSIWVSAKPKAVVFDKSTGEVIRQIFINQNIKVVQTHFDSSNTAYTLFFVSNTTTWLTSVSSAGTLNWVTEFESTAGNPQHIGFLSSGNLAVVGTNSFSSRVLVVNTSGARVADYEAPATVQILFARRFSNGDVLLVAEDFTSDIRFVCRLDSSMSTVWAKELDLTQFLSWQGLAADVDGDDNVYVWEIGLDTASVGNPEDRVVTKFDSAGNVLWTRELSSYSGGGWADFWWDGAASSDTFCSAVDEYDDESYSAFILPSDGSKTGNWPVADLRYAVRTPLNFVNSAFALSSTTNYTGSAGSLVLTPSYLYTQSYDAGFYTLDIATTYPAPEVSLYKTTEYYLSDPGSPGTPSIPGACRTVTTQHVDSMVVVYDDDYINFYGYDPYLDSPYPSLEPYTYERLYPSLYWSGYKWYAQFNSTSKYYNSPMLSFADDISASRKYVVGRYDVTYTTGTICDPVTPGTPATPPTYSPVPSAWDGGARSVEYFVKDGAIVSTTPVNPKGAIIGLNEQLQSAGYSDINFGFYFSGSLYRIIVNGSVVPSFAFRPVVTVAPFSIVAYEGTVYFYYNGALVYTAVNDFDPTARVYADVSLYGNGDSVNCLELTQITDAASSFPAFIVAENKTFSSDTTIIVNGSSAPFDPVTGIVTLPDGTELEVGVAAIYMISTSRIAENPTIDGISDRAVSFVSATEMQVHGGTSTFNAWIDFESTGSLSATPADIAEAPFGVISFSTSSRTTVALSEDYATALPALTGNAYGPNMQYGYSTASLPVLGGISTAGFVVPQLVTVEYFLPFLQSAATSITAVMGQSDTTLPILDGLSADHAYGESDVTLPAFQGFSEQAIVYDAVAFLELSEFEFSAYAIEQPESGLSKVLYSDNFVFESYTGAVASAVSPAFTVTTSATFPIVATAEIDVGFDVIASTSAGGVATAYLTMSMTPTLLAYSGSGLSILAPQFTATANVITGGVATVYTDFGVTLLSSGTAEDLVSAEIIMPQAVSLYGMVSASVPQFTLNVEGGEVVVRTVTTYVSHLSADAEITQYTGYDFDNVLYFNGKYYGVKADGMYLLEGDTDAGTNINVDIMTQEFDLDTARKKRVKYMYAGSDDVFTVTPYVDGVNAGTYTSSIGDERVYLPHGAQGRYWKFQYQNVDGNNFALDSVDVVVNVLRRKV